MIKDWSGDDHTEPSTPPGGKLHMDLIAYLQQTRHI